MDDKSGLDQAEAVDAGSAPFDSRALGFDPSAEPGGDVPGRDLLAAVLQTSVAAICVVDPTGQIVYANPVAEDILGLTPSEIVQRRYDAPEWRPTALDGGPWSDEEQPFRRVMRTGQPVHDIRHAIEWPDGQRKLLSINGAPIVDSAGRITSTVFSVTDITERVRIEERAVERDRWLRIALEAAQMGIWSWDIETGEVRWSDEVPPLFGIERGEFEGTYDGFMRCVHPRDRDRVTDTIQAALASDVPSYAIEHRILWPDGSVHWIESRGRIARGSGGVATGINGTMMDVTQRKAVELALRESDEAFRTVLETVPTYILSVARDHTIQLINRTMPQYEAEDVIGHNVLEFLTEDSRAEYKAALDRAFETGEMQEFEGDVPAPNGETIRFLIRMGPVKKGNEVESVTAVGLDITRLKQTEEALRESHEQLRQAQRLESVGRLAGGVAHDFNNLLTVVLGCSELLERALAGREDLVKLVRTIAESAERGATLTRQLLTFARRHVVQPRVVDVNEQIRAAAKMLERLIGENIDLRLELADSLWPVEIDPGELEQVLVNLAVNARDAMPNGGRLTIVSANSVDDEGAAPAQVVITVRDTGSGISKESLPFIFEPFFTTKQAGKGTGLGLATCFGIIGGAGGDIEVDSELGEGATFRVLLPSSAEAPEEAKSEEEHGALLEGRGTILFVEDDVAVRDIGRRTLRAAGYDLIEAENGCDALEKFELHRDAIDLVITDLVMPKMSGVELAGELMDLDPHLKVLFVSGYSAELSSLAKLSSDRVFLLLKPYTARELTEKVRDMNR